MTKVQRKAYLSNLEGYPCFTPTPHGCLPILAEQTASGVPGNEVNKISKARSSQKSNRNKR